MVLPLKEIVKIEFAETKIRVIYKDKTKMLINNSKNITFDLNYKNPSNIPLNNHCE